MNLTPSEQLTFSTIRIECILENGDVSTGTGFFFRFLESGENHVPAIITNKHVIDGAITGSFFLSSSDENGYLAGNHRPITFDQFEQRWIKHPDPEVDLCMLPIAEVLTLFVSTFGQSPFFVALNRSLILSEQEMQNLTALEEIIMIGYPNGIWDRFNNQPIIRRGVTATHPTLLYEGRHEFLVDAACFPGSSGSPIFLFNLGSFASRDGGLVIGSRIKLLGILYAGPQHTATGEIEIVNVPTQQKQMAISRIPNNLGLVIRAQRVLDFENILQDILQNRQGSL